MDSWQSIRYKKTNQGSQMIDKIKNYIEEETTDFYYVKQIVIYCANKIKTFTKEDNLLFQELLGQIATQTDTTSDKDLMQLIVDYKQGNLDSFRARLLDLFYSASSNNVGLLSISYPDIGKAFTKYGRENLNMLIIKIKESKWKNYYY